MAKRKTTRPRRQPGRDGQRTPGPRGGNWLYGWHPVAAALANPRRACRRLIVSEAARPKIEALMASAGVGTPPPIETVTRDQIEAHLPEGAVHQGVALLAEPLEPADLADTCREPSPRGRDTVVVLDQPSDPHNVGAVLRSAAALGARAVVVPDRHAPEATPVLAKAASGALDRLPLVRVVNLARALADLQSWGYWTVGLEAAAGMPLWQAELPERVVLVIGAEGEGLRRLTRESCDFLVDIPVATGTDSLNLSNAAAIALYEVMRAQR